MAAGLQFEIVARDPATQARAGLLHTPHGVVETPAFLPVGTAGTVKAMSQQQLEELGAQMLLANTYHLYLRPGHETIRELGGLHRFMSWPHPLLTDSGGFQVMSLKGLGRVTEDGVWFRSHLDGSSHFLSPERAVEIQLALGADIIMTLDECVEYPSSHETLRRALQLTGRWAARSRDYYERQLAELREEGSRKAGSGIRDSRLATREPGTGNRELGVGSGEWGTGSRESGIGDSGPTRPTSPASSLQPPASSPETSAPTPSLFGIVQGGVDKDLRRESAEGLLELGFEGYALGGLSVGEPKAEMYEVAEYSAGLLPPDRPRYLMGVGTPEDLVECVARGIDLFDCVLPTRNARNACLFTSEGKIIIKNARYARDSSPPDPACPCAVCRRYSRSYLRHLFAAGEMLGAMLATYHNLYFYLDTLREFRQALRLGRFGELCSRKRGAPGA